MGVLVGGLLIIAFLPGRLQQPESSPENAVLVSELHRLRKRVGGLEKELLALIVEYQTARMQEIPASPGPIDRIPGEQLWQEFEPRMEELVAEAVYNSEQKMIRRMPFAPRDPEFFSDLLGIDEVEAAKVAAIHAQSRAAIQDLLAQGTGTDAIGLDAISAALNEIHEAESQELAVLLSPPQLIDYRASELSYEFPLDILRATVLMEPEPYTGNEKPRPDSVVKVDRP